MGIALSANVPNCPMRLPSAPPPSSAFFKNSLVPDRAIVPRFLANSSLVIPIPVSVVSRVTYRPFW